MGVELPPSGLPPAPAPAGERPPSPDGVGKPVRNETPARRALARDIADDERNAAADFLADAPVMSHADLRDMLRRNVERLRALLASFPGEG